MRQKQYADTTPVEQFIIRAHWQWKQSTASFALKYEMLMHFRLRAKEEGIEHLLQ